MTKVKNMHWFSAMIIKNGLILACGVLLLSVYLAYINPNENLTDLLLFRQTLEIAKIAISLFSVFTIFGMTIEIFLKYKEKQNG